MDTNKIGEPEDILPRQPPLSPLFAVAINGKKKGISVVKWALENFVPEGKVMFKLFHVRAVIAYVPTPSKSMPKSSKVRKCDIR